MRRGILICTLLTGCAGATPSPSRPPSPEILDAVSTIADTGMRQQEMPGLALVVMNPGGHPKCSTCGHPKMLHFADELMPS